MNDFRNLNLADFLLIKLMILCQLTIRAVFHHHVKVSFICVVWMVINNIWMADFQEYSRLIFYIIKRFLIKIFFFYALDCKYCRAVWFATRFENISKITFANLIFKFKIFKEMLLAFLNFNCSVPSDTFLTSWSR